MGVLEHYVYAYQSFSGYVEYQYDPAPVCSNDYTCKTCPTSVQGCSRTPVCDNSNIIKCGCLASGVSTGSGSSLATATCGDTEQGQQCTSITCNNGYTRVGYPTCSSNGDWSGLTTSCSPVRDVRARSARISIISLFHVSIISLKLNECHSYHSLISTLGRILVYDEYLTRASRSNTGTMCVGSKCRQH